jgi:hypothetical protein
MKYEVALQRFIEALTNRELEHNAKNFPTLKPATFSVMPGRVFDKIVTVRSGSRSVYGFVRKSDGAIIKAASWKAPEPKQYERGNIYRANPLEGTGVYGVDYIR